MKKVRVKELVITDLAFVVVIVIAASNYVVCKWALEEVPAFTLMAVRYLLAITILTLMIYPKLRQISIDMMIKSLYLGLVLGVAVITWQIGIVTADHIGPAAFIVSLDGLMVPVFSWLIFGNRLTKNVVIAIPIALLGMGLLNLKEGMTVSESDLWFLGSALGFSFHILLTHTYSRRFDSASFAWGQVLVISLISMLAALIFDRGSVSLENILSVKYEILYLAAIATALRFTLQNFAQKGTSAATAGFLFATEPVVVAILAWLILREGMSNTQMIGCGFIFFAILYARNMLPSWMLLKSFVKA